MCWVVWFSPAPIISTEVNEKFWFYFLEIDLLLKSRYILSLFFPQICNIYTVKIKARAHFECKGKWVFFKFKLYFTVYAITVVPIFPLCTPPPRPLPPLPQVILTPLSTSMGLAIYILWLLYSLCWTLYPHDCSVTSNLYFLIPSPFFAHPPTSTPIRQPSKCSHQFCFCFAFSFILFFRFNYWFYCHFIVNIFNLLFKGNPLTFHIILVWWWWTPLAFSCLGSSLSVLQF